MTDCIFCKIISGAIPSTKIYEDEFALAFNDVNPQAPIHFLVIPKTHIPTLHHVNDDCTVSRMVSAIQSVTQKLDVQANGYRVVMNANEWGGQTVFHLHAHVLSGRPMQWPPG